MKILANGLVTRLNRGNNKLNQENKWDSLKASTLQIIFGEFSPQSTRPHQKIKIAGSFYLWMLSQSNDNSYKKY